jgi:hypothetical protein
MAREDGVRGTRIAFRFGYCIWQEYRKSDRQARARRVGVPYSNKTGVREDAGLTELELRTYGELWVLRDHGQGTWRARHTINVDWSSIRASKPLLPQNQQIIRIQC